MIWNRVPCGQSHNISTRYYSWTFLLQLCLYVFDDIKTWQNCIRKCILLCGVVCRWVYQNWGIATLKFFGSKKLIISVIKIIYQKLDAKWFESKHICTCVCASGPEIKLQIELAYSFIFASIYNWSNEVAELPEQSSHENAIWEVLPASWGWLKHVSRSYPSRYPQNDHTFSCRISSLDCLLGKHH